MSQDLFSVDQVAERLGLHVRTVRLYVREGRLKATRIGKQYRIARADLEAFTGQPVGPTAREAARRDRHVEASSIVQIDAIGPEEAGRIENTLAAFVNAQRDADRQRVQTLYDRHLGRLKVIVMGDLMSSIEVFQIVAKLS